MTLEEALKVAQGSPSAEERYIESCTVVLSAPEAKPEFKVEALISLGTAHGMARRLDLALADLDEAIHRDPTYDRGYANRAVRHSMAGNDHKALSELNRAINLNNTNAIAYIGSGQLFRRLRVIDKAIADVAMACALDEGNPLFERLWEQLLDESRGGTGKSN